MKLFSKNDQTSGGADWLIVGLGNPGPKYEMTRHNAGFLMLDAIAEHFNIEVRRVKFKGLYGKGTIAGQSAVLLKPSTFMNLSGESIRELVDYYKVDEETDLIVIYDDISLDVGQLRIRKKGSAGGHNGIKSIISHLGHDAFLRIKIGVGEKPRGYDLADYVLGHFEGEDKEKMEEAYEKAVQAVRMALHGDICEAMNQFNRKG